MPTDLETYLAAVEERDAEAQRDKAAYRRDDDSVYRSQADVPTLLEMVKRYRRYMSTCGPTMCETEVNIIARDAMEKSDG